MADARAEVTALVELIEELVNVCIRHHESFDGCPGAVREKKQEIVDYFLDRIGQL